MTQSQRFITKEDDSRIPKMMVQQLLQKNKVCFGPHYVSIYKSLHYLLDNDNMPMSKYRISNNKLVLNILLENNFIVECTDKKKVVTDYIRNKETKFYCLSPKGMEYIRVFEKLMGLFI